MWTYSCHRISLKDSHNWVGVKVKEGEILKYTWGVFGQQSESDALYGIQNSQARQGCVKQKIEIFCSIHIEDIEISEHYVTSNNRVIIWCRMQDYIVKEIFRVAQQIRSPDFQVKTFVPSIARERKRYIDMDLRLSRLSHETFRSLACLKVKIGQKLF